MEISVPAATNAIEDFLSDIAAFDDDIIEQCSDLLLNIWHIENAQIRMQIIQTAALNAGWLSEEDLN